jgi:hypothetical protein
MATMKLDISLLDGDKGFLYGKLRCRCLLAQAVYVSEISILLFGLTRRKEKNPAPPMFDVLPLV